jgi:acetoin utilization protein AcuB
MFVRDWMSQPAVTIKPGLRLSAALKVMTSRRMRRLPVVENARLIGIITKSDIESAMGRTGRKSLLDDRFSLDQTVGEVMTTDPVSVAPGETIEGAAVAMSTRRISGLPVVENDKVVGMITETDIFRALIDMLGFNEGGARVVLALSSVDSLIHWLQKFSKGPRVRSLVTYRDPVTRNLKALVRLWGKGKSRPKEAAHGRQENSGRR